MFAEVTKEEFALVTGRQRERMNDLFRDVGRQMDALELRVKFLEDTIRESPELRAAYDEFKKEEALRRFEESQKWG